MYAGELIKITTTAKDFNSLAFPALELPDLVVTISIFDAAHVAVVSNVLMTFDVVNGNWYYLWNTHAVPQGTYRPKCVLEDPDGHLSWDWSRIRLAKNPV